MLSASILQGSTRAWANVYVHVHKCAHVHEHAQVHECARVRAGGCMRPRVLPHAWLRLCMSGCARARARRMRTRACAELCTPT
eukprot:12600233-Alexandrium_andersonii.AAC.1